MNACLEAIGLCHRYGSKSVVKDLSLTVQHGEIIGLLGPNGAGKTTTFRMIAGTLAPDAGRILLNGRDLARLPLWKRARLGLGYLPQGPTLFRRLTVAENIKIGFSSRLSPNEKKSQLCRIIELLNLQSLKDALGQTLSGGERRRAEIARALATNPQMLLIDEPFAGLDPLSIESLSAHLTTLAAQGLAILLTDHDVPQTLRLCHRISILIQGQILATGTAAELEADPKIAELYLGHLTTPHSSPP